MREVIAAALLLASSAALAEDKTTYALNNLQMEMTVCAVYYSQVKACIGRDNLKKTIGVLTKRLFDIGKTLGASQDAMLSRLQMAQDDENKLLKGTRHADRCKIVVETPDTILKEYLDK
jgi:hypothetical protein